MPDPATTLERPVAGAAAGAAIHDVKEQKTLAIIRQEKLVTMHSITPESQILKAMIAIGIEYYIIKTQIVIEDGAERLADEMRFHMRGDPPGVTATANEYTSPTFNALKAFEAMVMGETS